MLIKNRLILTLLAAAIVIGCTFTITKLADLKGWFVASKIETKDTAALSNKTHFFENSAIDVGRVIVGVSKIVNFTCTPNPVILWTPKQQEAKFKIIKTKNSACNLGELQFIYDKNTLSLAPQKTKTSAIEECEYSLCLLQNKEGTNSHHVNIYDPTTEESITLTLVSVSRRQ